MWILQHQLVNNILGPLNSFKCRTVDQGDNVPRIGQEKMVTDSDCMNLLFLPPPSFTNFPDSLLVFHSFDNREHLKGVWLKDSGKVMFGLTNSKENYSLPR